MVKHHQKITRLVPRLIRDPAEVEDVTRDAFTKAYRALPQFRGESAFHMWLYHIAVNTAGDYLAMQGRCPESPSDVDTEEVETFTDGGLLRDINTPDFMLHTKQVAETVNRTMEVLPEELRTVIILREIEGPSCEEIVEAMERPIGTVRSRIFRAREAIAEKLRLPLGTTGSKW